MANPTAGTPAPATIAGTTPAKGVPNTRPTPPRRLAAPAHPEAETASDFAIRLEEIGVHWWSLIHGIFEMRGTERWEAEPVPQWALDRLGDQGRHHDTHEEHRLKAEGLRELLRAADGLHPKYVFEVWGDRNTRLSLRHESIADAMPDLVRFKESGEWPKASIVKVHRMNTCSMASDPALLDTLVGQVWFAGVSLPLGDEDEHIFQIQDSTGRIVSLPASDLRGHVVIDRIINLRNKASLQAWLQEDLKAKKASHGGAQ